jgi:hypothetical protein
MNGSKKEYLFMLNLARHITACTFLSLLSFQQEKEVIYEFCFLSVSSPHINFLIN